MWMTSTGRLVPLDPDGNDSLELADNDIPVVLEPGEEDEDNNFIEDPLQGSISGSVYNDLGLAMFNVTVTLYNDTDGDGNEDGAPISTRLTNISGQYQFTSIEPGDYVIVETQPLYHNNISDIDTSIHALDLDGDDSVDGPDNDIPVVLTAGEADADNNFENGRPGTICG